MQQKLKQIKNFGKKSENARNQKNLQKRCNFQKSYSRDRLRGQISVRQNFTFYATLEKCVKFAYEISQKNLKNFTKIAKKNAKDQIRACPKKSLIYFHFL